MDDRLGLIIKPSNYLIDQVVRNTKTGEDETHCVLLVQRNDQIGIEKEYVLGTVFLHSYY